MQRLMVGGLKKWLENGYFASISAANDRLDKLQMKSCPIVSSQFRQKLKACQNDYETLKKDQDKIKKYSSQIANSLTQIIKANMNNGYFTSLCKNCKECSSDMFIKTKNYEKHLDTYKNKHSHRFLFGDRA